MTDNKKIFLRILFTFFVLLFGIFLRPQNVLAVNTPPPISTPSSPGNTATVNGNGSLVTLTTNAVVDADGQTVQYNFRVASGSDGETGTVCNSDWQTSTTYSCNPGPGTFYWHVYTYDGYNQTNPNYVWSFYNNYQPYGVSVSPSSGSFPSGARTFTSVYRDPNGGNDIYYVHLLINYGVDGNNSAFYGYYVRSSNSCYLFNSDNAGGWPAQSWGTARATLPWVTLNSCSSSVSGTDLTVNWNVTFNTWNENPLYEFLYVVDNSSSAWGWGGPYGPISASSTVVYIPTFPSRNSYIVSTSAGANGTISPSSREISQGYTTTFTVTPNVGYYTASASGCGGSLSGTTYTTGAITADCTVTASFSTNFYTLSVTKAGNGFGIITSNPAGIDCGGICSATYSFTAVTLTATPNANSTFAGWNGDCSPNGAVIIDSGKSCTATFTYSQPPIVPTITSLSSAPYYPNGTYSYSFNATDPGGYQVRYGIDWSMPADGVADEWLPGGVTYVNSGVSQDTSHSWPTTGTQTFQVLAQNFPGVNSAWSAPYNVSIVGVPVTGTCGTRNVSYVAGTLEYPGGSTYCSYGTATTSPAFPAPGATVYWGCEGSNGGENDYCHATLVYTIRHVTVTKTTGGGVKSTDNIINCGTTCVYDYNDGSTVTLQAVPDSTYWRFIQWLGNCSGTSPTCVLNVDGTKDVTALFGLTKFTYQEF